MGMGILGWQLLILVTIVVAGRSRAIAVIFWVIWTLVQVAALPLSILQFGTIWLGHTIAAALFPSRPDDTTKASSTPPRKEVPPTVQPKQVSAVGEGKPPAPKTPQPTSLKELSELLGPMMKDISLPSMPSASTRSKVDWLARHHQEKELEGIRQQIREIYRKSPSEAVSVRKEANPSTPASTPAPARAPASPRPVSSGNAPHPDQDFSESLIDHLEMLNRSSVDRTPSELPSITKSPANTRKGACVTCDPQRSKAVSGMRYCGDCGAFVGMAH